MLIQLDNDLPITSHHALLPTLAKAVEVVDTRQPALVHYPIGILDAFDEQGKQGLWRLLL